MPTALLIIDVQQGLCEGDSAPYDLAGTIARINLVAATARAAGAPVIFIQHEGRDGYLEHGSDGWQLARDLEVASSDLRVRKTAADSFHLTELASVLDHHGVKDLVICGMHTEFCVDTTTRRALALGYPVVLVSDAHTTAGHADLSPALVIRHHNHTLGNITSFGPRVRLVPAAELTFEA